jgi:hypothetical protein
LQTRVLAAHLLLALEAIVDRVEDELRLDLDEHKQRPLHLPASYNSQGVVTLGQQALSSLGKAA